MRRGDLTGFAEAEALIGWLAVDEAGYHYSELLPGLGARVGLTYALSRSFGFVACLGVGGLMFGFAPDEAAGWATAEVGVSVKL